MARGGYTPFEIREMEGEDLLFLDYYQSQLERERMKDLAYILGCRWTAEDLVRMSDSADKKSDEPFTSDALFIPLALAVNPELSEYLAKKGKSVNNPNAAQAHIGGGSASVEKNSVVKSFGQLSKEDFLNMVGGIGGRRS